jgi:hypothetical protein
MQVEAADNHIRAPGLLLELIQLPKIFRHIVVAEWNHLFDHVLA